MSFILIIFNYNIPVGFFFSFGVCGYCKCVHIFLHKKKLHFSTEKVQLLYKIKCLFLSIVSFFGCVFVLNLKYYNWSFTNSPEDFHIPWKYPLPVLWSYFPISPRCVVDVMVEIRPLKKSDLMSHQIDCPIVLKLPAYSIFFSRVKWGKRHE